MKGFVVIDSQEENSPVPPDFVYKYVAPPPSLDDSCKSVFWERCFTTIKFKDPKDLNDPFDMKPNIIFDGTGDDWRLFLKNNPASDLDKKRINECIENAVSLSKNELPSYLIDSMNSSTNKLVVCCLTESADDILMWSHYADSHRGVCLKYNAKAWHKDEYFKKVEYYPKYLSFKNDIAQANAEAKARKVLCCKSDHWVYEKEWRIIRDGANSPRYVPLPANVLTGVIFGLNMSLADRNQIRLQLEKINSSVELYEARKNDSGYKLDIEPLS